MTTALAVATMKAAQVTAAGAGLRIVELEIPDPGPGQVRIKVRACGVCHSDAINRRRPPARNPLSARSRA
jgi:alcohol dehydrogenase/propanol-preferring alcohol dehydrogenase